MGARLFNMAVASVMTVGVQAAAILVLPPAEYGAFALCYLALGLGSAAVYAIVSEAWSRQNPSEADWPDYSVVLCAVVALSTLPLVVIAALVGQGAIGIVYSAAVAGTLYRTAARYFELTFHESPLIGLPDLISVLIFGAAFFAVAGRLDASWTVAVSWMLGAAAAAALSRRPVLRGHGSFRRWLRDRAGAIRPLALDSALLEVSNTVIPLALTPLMGIANFGVYRAISSAAVPTRLVLNPLRPQIARLSTAKLFRSAAVLLATGASVLIATAVAVILYAVAASGFAAESTLSELSRFALPVSCFVWANFLDTLVYFGLRSRGSAGELIVYRLSQVGASLMFPVAGYFVGGVEGAAWGIFAVSLLAGVVGVWLMLRRMRNE